MAPQQGVPPQQGDPLAQDRSEAPWDGAPAQGSRPGEVEDDPFFRQEQQLREQNGDLPPKAPEFGTPEDGSPQNRLPEDGVDGEAGDARR